MNRQRMPQDGEKLRVRVKSIEESLLIRTRLHSLGYSWFGGQSILVEKWREYGSDTIYNIYENERVVTYSINTNKSDCVTMVDSGSDLTN